MRIIFVILLAIFILPSDGFSETIHFITTHATPESHQKAKANAFLMGHKLIIIPGIIPSGATYPT